MRIEDTDRVNHLRAEREKALRIHAAATGGVIEGLHIWKNGERFEIFPQLPIEPFRSAIIETAADQIVAINKELASLGVGTPKFEICEMDATGWRRTSEMYLRVWIRTLGGRLINKWHLIDALAMTTEQMREKAEKWDAHVAAGAKEKAA